VSTGFPQFAHSAKQGEHGVSLVGRVVTDAFGWLFRRNHQEHDFGIDGHIELVTDDGAVTGQIIACQIKCGESFFRDRNKWGYVYRGELKHFNYLSNYPVPVLIVICEPVSRECYWVHFQAEQSHLTEAGWRLTIPYENKLSESKLALRSLLPALTDSLSELQDYWRVNNMIVECSVVTFMLDDADVRARDVSGPQEFFRRLRATKELAYECRGKVEISFFGYDDDPRELFEIDEVRRYVELLDKAIPELFFFVRAEEPTYTLRTLALCLCNVTWEGERSTPKVARRVVVDIGGILGFLERHFLGLNEISDWLGLPEEENKKISCDVARLLGVHPPSES
jgi:hypothetical protein